MILTHARVVTGVLMVTFGVKPASAQSPWLISGRLAFVEQRVDAGFGPERFSGFGLGLEIQRRVGSRFTAGLRAQGATIQPAVSGDLDRRIGEAELSGTMAITGWWGLYGGLTLRAVANDAGRQRWVLGRIGAEVHPAFTGERIRAVGRLGVIPVVSVSGLSPSAMAFDGAAGLEYDRDRVVIRLLYGLERFAFSSSNGTRRAEQVSSLTFRAGIRMSGDR